MSDSKKNLVKSIGLTLPDDLAQDLTAYMARVVEHQGSIPFGLKTTIAMMAIKEWLERHKDDLGINFSRPTGNRKH